MLPATKHGIPFRRDIEGMRAVAVSLVVLNHIGLSAFGGGYVGVDVFFVISGFLITSLLLEESSRTGTISIAQFYARRATRLLPASTVVLVGTLVAAWLWLPPLRLESISRDALLSAVYGINYWLAVSGTDYFASDGAPSPLQHYWSLAVEEQFYLIWPILLLVCARLWGTTGVRRGTVGVLVALSAASFLASVQQTSTAVSWAYFGSHTRAWELALGALVALGAGSFTRLGAALAASLTWVGLGLVVGSAFVFDEHTAFPGALAALPVLGAVLVLVGGSSAPRGGALLLLGTRPFQLVGKLSYGWYLWHWPVLVIGPAALGARPSLLVNVGLALVAFGLAVASYVWIEEPVRRRRSFRLVPARGIALGMASSAGAVAVAGLAAWFAPPSVGRGVAPDTVALVSNTDAPAAVIERQIAESVEEEDVPMNLTPTLLAADEERLELREDGCHLEFRALEPDRPCVYGDPDAETTVVLFGDSHAAQWFPALEDLAESEAWRLHVMTKSACPASSVDVWNTKLKRVYDECMRWRDETLEDIRDLDPDLVIMSSIEQGTSELLGDHADPDRVWAEGWVKSFRRVEDPDTDLVLILDTPRPTVDVPECLSLNIDEATECGMTPEQAVRAPRRRQLVAEAVRRMGVVVVDPTPWFCTAEACPPVIGNVLVYRDTNHISGAYARALAPVLESVLSL